MLFLCIGTRAKTAKRGRTHLLHTRLMVLHSLSLWTVGEGCASWICVKSAERKETKLVAVLAGSAPKAGIIRLLTLLVVKSDDSVCPSSHKQKIVTLVFVFACGSTTS